MTRVTQLFLPINVLYNSRENIELDGNLYCIHHPFSRNRFMALDMLGFFFLSLVHTTMSTKFIRWWPTTRSNIDSTCRFAFIYTRPSSAERNERKNGRCSLQQVVSLCSTSFIFYICHFLQEFLFEPPGFTTVIVYFFPFSFVIIFPILFFFGWVGFDLDVSLDIVK